MGFLGDLLFFPRKKSHGFSIIPKVSPKISEQTQPDSWKIPLPLDLPLGNL